MDGDLPDVVEAPRQQNERGQCENSLARAADGGEHQRRARDQRRECKIDAGERLREAQIGGLVVVVGEDVLRAAERGEQFERGDNGKAEAQPEMARPAKARFICEPLNLPMVPRDQTARTVSSQKG